ncbi:uncharacterized protein G2W53_026125 [Senna tora]|uniref:Uncharacterized protein n=1 Tax=Senna tora TaxID=362788 RepID=A0A834WET6_9FABA|nr:uncharacterized protein G2W53_026125 [Senna tora]
MQGKDEAKEEGREATPKRESVRIEGKWKEG